MNPHFCRSKPLTLAKFCSAVPACACIILAARADELPENLSEREFLAMGASLTGGIVDFTIENSVSSIAIYTRSRNNQIMRHDFESILSECEAANSANQTHSPLFPRKPSTKPIHII